MRGLDASGQYQKCASEIVKQAFESIRALFKWNPLLDHMRILGAPCYAHVTKGKRKKLDDSGSKCLFLGFSKDHKAYRLLNAEDGSIVVSRSVTFAEHAVSKERRR